MSRKLIIVTVVVSLFAVLLLQSKEISVDRVGADIVMLTEFSHEKSANVSTSSNSFDEQGGYAAVQLPSVLVEDYTLDQEIELSIDSEINAIATVVELLESQANQQRVIRPDHHGQSAISDDARIILSLEGQGVNLELINDGRQIHAAVLHEPKQSKIYRAAIDPIGQGSFVEEDVNAYYCLKYPEEKSQLEDDIPSSELIADINLLRNLQGNPNSSKVLYLDYWGGQTNDTAWNFFYNNNLPIDYDPFSIDNNVNDFSDSERYLIWLGWVEVVEDYAAFDINVTTSEAVYNSASVRNRAKLNITNTDAWFGESAGGVAYVGVFSFTSDFYKTGWVWNTGASSMGMSISHEAGHIMGLSHDGIASQSYYGGHGDWGPIMGAPFGKKYVQWSQGDYTNANQQQDDIAIIESRLDFAISDASNDELLPTQLTLPVNQRLGNIGFDQNVSNSDHYQFTLTDPQNIEIEVISVLGDDGESRAGNLAMTVSLVNVDANTEVLTVDASEPLSPLSNVFTFNALLGAANYRLSIQPDSPNTSASTGFDNYGNGGLYRFSVSGEQIIAPDLLASEIETSATVLYAGQTFEISSVVSNVGNQTAEATTLYYYQSSDSVIDNGDTQIASEAVPQIVSDGISDHSEVVAAPSQVGTYWYGVCVDSVTDEVTTTNNCSVALAVEVQNPPDLILESLQVVPNGLFVDDTVSVSVNVKNEGDADSQATNLRYYRSNDSTISTGDVEISTDAVGELAQNIISPQSAILAMPSVSGTYWYGACVDAVTGESNTANNCSGAVSVTISGRPDLTVNNFMVDDTSVVSGQSVQFSASVVNSGLGQSAISSLEFYLSTNADISTSDQLLASSAVNALSASAQANFSVPIEVISSTSNVWLGACINAVDGELTTNNNCSAGIAVSLIEPADLVVSSLLLNKQAVNTNETIIVSATAQNIGDESSDTTTLRYYFSDDNVFDNSDEEFGSDLISVLVASASSVQTGQAFSPSDEGDFWVFACVDTFAAEASNENNCTAGVPLSVLEGDIYEQNDVITESVDLIAEEPQAHSIVPSNDVDWLKVTLVEDTSLRLFVESDNAGVTISLYDESEELIPPTDYQTSSEDSISITVDYELLAANDYFIEILGDGLSLANYAITAKAPIPTNTVCDFFTIPIEGGSLVLICL